MPLNLCNFDQQARAAVKAFWQARDAARQKQQASGKADQGEGAFGAQERPFVGWLMVVEDAPASRAPVKDKSPHFPVFPEFAGASYLQRYDTLCQKLAREQLYSSAAVIATPRTAVADGAYTELSPMTGLRSFVASLAGHIAAEAARA